MSARRDQAVGHAPGDRVGELPADDELLEAYATTRFDGLFREMAAELHAYASRSVGADHAEDLVSDTFLVVWRRWSEVPTDLSERRAWVYAVLKYVIRSTIRGEARRARLFHRVVSQRAPDPGNDPGDALIGQARIAELLQRLPEGQARAIELTILDDLPVHDAARRLGISVTALTTRLSRARQTLRTYLTSERRDDAPSAARE